ncbi:hypothetical protein ACHAXA_007961 [Cyclostephanos tholiformis]|uniref:Uncharacterized protein n=1 Tax=Cyclostephanos tholiformis TaxID=382380 RepID=A0ABD3RPG8_9STRA
MPIVLRCDPKLLEKDLKDQVVIVTGANSGCGLETSRQLSKQGATVVLACRNGERGEAAAREVNGVFIAPLDLSSLESVRSFVAAFKSKFDRLDALVNNAGVMACPHATTKDGFEWQFGCNHLAHFLLMQLLTPLLLTTAEKTSKPSRFVALSSVVAGHSTLMGPATVDLDDLNWKSRSYDEFPAYAQSKLCNYLHATEAGNRYPRDKLISCSVHPGWVLSPLDSHVVEKIFGRGAIGKFVADIFRKFFLWKGDMITPKDGAQTTLYCLLEDANKMQSGKFYSQFGVYKDKASKPGGWPMVLVNPNITPELGGKLWEVSEKLVGV